MISPSSHGHALWTTAHRRYHREQLAVAVGAGVILALTTIIAMVLG